MNIFFFYFRCFKFLFQHDFVLGLNIIIWLHVLNHRFPAQLHSPKWNVILFHLASQLPTCSPTAQLPTYSPSPIRKKHLKKRRNSISDEVWYFTSYSEFLISGPKKFFPNKHGNYFSESHIFLWKIKFRWTNLPRSVYIIDNPLGSTESTYFLFHEKTLL